jgi:hypothetical protein
MRGMFQLPNFTVVVWTQKTDDYHSIRDRLLELAVDDPYESSEREGMVDFHWGFDQEEQAYELVNALKELVERPEIVLLRVTSRDGPNPPKTIKDERNTRH